MLAVLTVTLYALVVVVALLLIGLILIQPSKSGGLGAAFGGIGESVFGAQVGSHLTKVTVFLTALFFVLTLLLATLIGHGANRSGAYAGVDAALRRAAAAEDAYSSSPAENAAPGARAGSAVEAGGAVPRSGADAAPAAPSSGGK